MRACQAGGSSVAFVAIAPSSVVDGGRNCAGEDRCGNGAAAAGVLVSSVQPALTGKYEPAQRPVESVDLTRDNDAGHEAIPAAFGLVDEDMGYSRAASPSRR